MSFLNPVSEPVLRFSSIDAGAPQINYNSRVAGDVKAVLKACLVTGYGATASAGWSIVNEVDHVAEFVSPSAAMSDYRLGIDDTSTSSTTWYHQYQDVRVNPSYNASTKSFSNINKSHASNGWQLIVTERGFMFVELVYSTQVNKLSARLTYYSQVKSALVGAENQNIMFFNIGHNSSIPEPKQLYSLAYPYFALNNYNSDNSRISSVSPFAFGNNIYAYGISNVDLISAMYLMKSTNDVIIAEVVGLLNKTVNNTVDLYDISDIAISGRPAFQFCCGISYASNSSAMIDYARTFIVYLDYWEY